MLITRQVVSQTLLAYLNGQMSLADLVAWAEACFVEGGFSPDSDIPLLRDIVSALAGADTPILPLTWEDCRAYMEALGTPIHAVSISDA
jgi:hypothetical protein